MIEVHGTSAQITVGCLDPARIDVIVNFKMKRPILLKEFN